MAHLIVAVKSTFKDLFAGEHNRIRGSWGQQLRGKAQLKFFIARQSQREGAFNVLTNSPENSYTAKSDEYILDCLDDRNNMVKKVRGICQYTMDKIFSHVLIVDVRHNLNVEAALSAPYEFADYAGDFKAGLPGGAPEPVWFTDESGVTVVMDQCYPWAYGDSGYYLSRRAAMEIAEHNPSVARYIVGSNDDVWVGQVLGQDIIDGEFIASQLESVTI